MSQVQQGNEEAYRLVGDPIRISGRGRHVRIRDGKVNTKLGDAAEIIMEYVSNEASNENEGTESANQRLVAFRLKDTNLYLSQNPFGNVAKAETLSNISALPILAEISREIVDFAVGEENNSNSAVGEGEGFDYRPMQLEEGPPGLLQKFTLEGRNLYNVGVKSVYGKYWRAPDWSDKVLQSPNHLGDEEFSFSPVFQPDEMETESESEDD